MSNIEGGTDRSEICKAFCPNYSICKNLESQATAMILSSIGSVGAEGEYENEDGTYTPASEIFRQNDDIPLERRVGLREIGQRVQREVVEISKSLIAGCVNGPVPTAEFVFEDTYTCRSTNKNEMHDRLEQLQHDVALDDVSIMILRDFFPNGTGEIS